MATHDFAHWTCPDCGHEIESDTIVDDKFGLRIEQHEREHVVREVVVEVAPSIIAALGETAERCRTRKTDDSDVDMLEGLAEVLSEGFVRPGGTVIVTESVLTRLREMAEAMAIESRPVYAETLGSILQQVEGLEDSVETDQEASDHAD